MKNTYVIDTSVLVADFNVLFAYPNTDIIIPSTVIDELDNLKKRADDVGRNAREVIRVLDNLLLTSKENNIREGIKLDNGSKLTIFAESILNEINPNDIKNDDKIIYTALKIKEVENIIPIVVSQDAGLRIKAKIAGLEATKYDCVDKNIKDQEDFYTGLKIINQNDLSEKEINHIFSKRSGVSLPNFNFFPNQFVRIEEEAEEEKTDGKKEIKKIILWEGIYKNDGFLYPIKNYKKVSDITPLNSEQKYAMHLLMDNKIELVTLKGKAGSGKTLLSIASALQQVEDGLYDRLIITKPTVSVGKELGFFPGSKDEKLAPWLGSIYDNLRVIKSDSEIDFLIGKGIIEFEAVSLFRGRNLPNAILLIDEAQNLNKIEAKTLVTRAGKDTKIIMTYDSCQIDSLYLDMTTNGATHVTEKMKEQDLAGHMTLITGERSNLASIAAEIL